MQGGKGKLILDGNNDIGVWLCSNIPASMKKKVYETEIVATAKNLYAASVLASADRRKSSASYAFIRWLYFIC